MAASMCQEFSTKSVIDVGCAIDFRCYRPKLIIYEPEHLSPEDRAESIRVLKGNGYIVRPAGMNNVAIIGDAIGKFFTPLSGQLWPQLSKRLFIRLHIMFPLCSLQVFPIFSI